MKVTFCILLGLCMSTLFLPLPAFPQIENKSVYGVLIDNTGSLRTELSDIKILANAIVQSAADRAIVSVFNFQSVVSGRMSIARTTSGTEWSEDRNAIEKHILGIETATGRTRLLDAIRSVGNAVDTVARKESRSEKIVILITDGADVDSEVTIEQLIQELKDTGIRVYVIGLVAGLDSGGPEKKMSQNFLRKITKETSGNVVFPDLRKRLKVEDILKDLFSAAK